MYDGMRLRNRSWPAVSHNCNRICTQSQIFTANDRGPWPTWLSMFTQLVVNSVIISKLTSLNPLSRKYEFSYFLWLCKKNKKNLVEIVHLPSVPYLQLEMNTCCHAYILLIITVNGHIVTLELRPKSPLIDPVQSNDSGTVQQNLSLQNLSLNIQQFYF